MESEARGLLSMPAEITAPDERVSAYGWKALAGSAIGFSMDGFDMLILGFMLSTISADLGFTSMQAGSLVTWTMLGAVTGGLIFGSMSDHLGRIRVLAWTILIFAAFTALCALSRGYWDLVVYRTVAGLGLGGEFGIGMALATEAWPASKRARASSYLALRSASGCVSDTTAPSESWLERNVPPWHTPSGRGICGAPGAP